ncbi:Longevity assurance proteins LAG1/LAC1 [Mycena venus]|uniref:Longevity assurance proteins LAG1/LAC1 n=1 Tax=Mycena venus TaxID=2733690 RepID=A0A8H6YRJ1_9AGAR|nr:Longevity assurance proteins LAG1/LAC1 [Mycena venus]
MYCLQQFLMLISGLEKRGSGHWELVIHHVIAVSVVSWSYLMPVTLLGSAVFVSMNAPVGSFFLWLHSFRWVYVHEFLEMATFFPPSSARAR